MYKVSITGDSQKSEKKIDGHNHIDDYDAEFIWVCFLLHINKNLLSLEEHLNHFDI